MDAYLYTQVTPQVKVTNKIEMKPHDAVDAARLYGELEEKAKKAVAGATIAHLGANNEIKIVKAATHYDFLEQITYLRILFSVNGVDHDIEVRADDTDVARAVNKVVAYELFKQLENALNDYNKNDLFRKIK